MSRFVDPTRTHTVTRSCECKGKPHTEDIVELRAELGYAAIGRIGMAGMTPLSEQYDFPESQLALIAEGLVSWNLVDVHGKPMGTDRADWNEAITPETVDWITTELNDLLTRAREPVPNASGAPSPSTTRGSASRTRKTPKSSARTRR